MIKNAISNSKCARTHNVICALREPTKVTAEIFFCTLNQNPGVNARILYYKKTTRLVKRTAEYKTTSIINVFT